MCIPTAASNAAAALTGSPGLGRCFRTGHGHRDIDGDEQDGAHEDRGAREDERSAVSSGRLGASAGVGSDRIEPRHEIHGEDHDGRDVHLGVDE